MYPIDAISNEIKICRARRPHPWIPRIVTWHTCPTLHLFSSHCTSVVVLLSLCQLLFCYFRSNVRVLSPRNISPWMLEKRGDRGGRSDLWTTSHRKMHQTRRRCRGGGQPRISWLPCKCIEFIAHEMFRQETVWSTHSWRRSATDRAMPQGAHVIPRSQIHLRRRYVLIKSILT